MHDLNDLVDPDDPLAAHVTLDMAVDINDHGVILATGNNSQTTREAVYLLRPKGSGGGSVDGVWILALILLVTIGRFPVVVRRAFQFELTKRNLIGAVRNRHRQRPRH